MAGLGVRPPETPASNGRSSLRARNKRTRKIEHRSFRGQRRTRRRISWASLSADASRRIRESASRARSYEILRLRAAINSTGMSVMLQAPRPPYVRRFGRGKLTALQSLDVVRSRGATLKPLSLVSDRSMSAREQDEGRLRADSLLRSWYSLFKEGCNVG